MPDGDRPKHFAASVRGRGEVCPVADTDLSGFWDQTADWGAGIPEADGDIIRPAAPRRAKTMERDPTSVLLATIATAGALTLSDVLIRWASSARDLYRGLKKLREADAIEIRGDSAEVDQLMQELKKISAMESDDTAESARD